MMKLIIVFTLFILLMTGCSCEKIIQDFIEDALTNETYQDTIKQDIGGFLIRKIHHWDEFTAGSRYNIEYFYKKNDLDTSFRIGYGTYYSQKPPEIEKIIKIANWLVFKTSGDRNMDFLFICNDTLNIWNKYEISPDSIEETQYWKNFNINSAPDNWDSISKISEIDKNGIVTVWYNYAIKNRVFNFQTGKRKILYKIDLETGNLNMIKISKE